MRAPPPPHARFNATNALLSMLHPQLLGGGLWQAHECHMMAIELTTNEMHLI